MNLREVVPQVLEALQQSRVCLEDGPTVLVLSHRGKRVQVQVTKEGGLFEAFHRESVEARGEAPRKGFEGNRAETPGKRQIGLVPLQ